MGDVLMAKTRTRLDVETGRTEKVTRAMHASEQRLIPWTRGPQKRWQKLVRKAIG